MRKLDARERERERERADFLHSSHLLPSLHSSHLLPSSRSFPPYLSGTQLLHAIGSIYISKASTFLKSKRFFGGGFLSKLKEKGTLVKEGWGVLGSAVGVQMAMEEMQKQQEKGTLGEEEL